MWLSEPELDLRPKFNSGHPGLNHEDTQTQIYGGSTLGLPTMHFGVNKNIFQLTQRRVQPAS